MSTAAKACPKCGAPQPAETKPITWVILALCVVTAAVGFAVAPDSAAQRCGPIDRAALGLPADKQEATADFIAKANRINASGECVIEGSYGTGYQRFYFAVHRPGQRTKPYHVRFSRDDLRR